MSDKTEAQRLAALCDNIDDLFDDQIVELGYVVSAELLRLEAENTRMQASLEECSGNCTALKDQVRRLRSELDALRGAVPAGSLALDAALGYIERNTPHLVYSEIKAALAAAPQPTPKPTGLIVSKHFDPLTGASIPDQTTFGEQQ
jgi:hypothetical protein